MKEEFEKEEIALISFLAAEGLVWWLMSILNYTEMVILWANILNKVMYYLCFFTHLSAFMKISNFILLLTFLISINWNKQASLGSTHNRLAVPTLKSWPLWLLVKKKEENFNLFYLLSLSEFLSSLNIYIFVKC